ncbi:hypothetical protein EP30_06420 [Bifidobacterium sp. UTCIF-39]|nr:hypothetical protein EP30_06420 [Bifidobacterium sp. UTCIF-39]
MSSFVVVSIVTPPPSIGRDATHISALLSRRSDDILSQQRIMLGNRCNIDKMEIGSVLIK